MKRLKDKKGDSEEDLSSSSTVARYFTERGRTLSGRILYFNHQGNGMKVFKNRLGLA